MLFYTVNINGENKTITAYDAFYYSKLLKVENEAKLSFQYFHIKNKKGSYLAKLNSDGSAYLFHYCNNNKKFIDIGLSFIGTFLRSDLFFNFVKEI